MGLGVLASGACAAVPDDPVLAIAGASHQYRELAGTTWHWVEAGSGPVVVLLHGLPEDWSAWRHQIAALAPTHRVIAIDLKGFGESEADLAAYDFRSVAAQITALLRAEEIDRYALVGHDWGAFIGAFMAQSEAVTSYVHVAAALWRYDLSRVPDLRDFHADPASVRSLMRGSDVFVTSLLELGAFGGLPSLGTLAVERYTNQFRRRSVRDAVERYFEDLELGRDWSLQGDSGADWMQVEAPTTLLVGDRDLLVPLEEFHEMAGRHAGLVSMRVIDDAGHYPHEEQPEQVNRILMEVIGS